MDTTSPRDVLAETEHLRARARADSHPSSVPLLVFGLLALVGAPLADEPVPIGLGSLYWTLAAPAGCLAIAWWYRRHRARTGVGGQQTSYLIAAPALLVALFLIPLWLYQVPMIAVALLVIAIRQQNWYLSAWAAVFGIAGFVLPFYLPMDPVAGFALLGLLLVVAGLVALLRERGRA
jgi:hypothetical protein